MTNRKLRIVIACGSTAGVGDTGSTARAAARSRPIAEPQRDALGSDDELACERTLPARVERSRGAEQRDREHDIARMIEHRCAECVDAGDRMPGRSREAALANGGERRREVLRGDPADGTRPGFAFE